MIKRLNDGFLIVLSGVMLLVFKGAEANPSNPTVTSGSADFATPSSTTLEITVSDRAIISWESFSIDSQEITNFILPSSNAAVLNRVSTNLSSTIDGLLTSNGIVYLINPNGILVTSNGQINTAGFLASTLDALDSEFLAGGNTLFSGSSINSVINQGRITGWDGDVVLIGYRVDNQQTIGSLNGVTAGAAGTAVMLTPGSTPLLTVQASIPPFFPDGTGVSQAGIIQALQAELQADGNLYAFAVKNDGWVNAVGVSQSTSNGHVYLTTQQGFVENSGIVSATNADDSGGEIHILGTVVSLTDNAEVYASGKSNAGIILIGGSLHGQDQNILNAQNTNIDPKVVVSANSLNDGNGGTVVVWAEDFTGFYGTIRARGGPVSGDGGTIEVSGVNELDFQGTTDTSAPRGTLGTLLLDPASVEIGLEPRTNAFRSFISISHLLESLKTSNVQLIASKEGANEGGYIIISAPLNWEGEDLSHLDLQAAGDIIINAPMTNHTVQGSLTLQAERSIIFGAGGELVTSSSGNTHMVAGDSITLSSTSEIINTGSGKMTINPPFSIGGE
jgi:filamentous hemagglutinin family protein